MKVLAQPRASAAPDLIIHCLSVCILSERVQFVWEGKKWVTLQASAVTLL